MCHPWRMSIDELAALIADARSVVAFTGAGISTESGIPDFRGPQGIWTTVDPNEFTIQKYVADPDHRKRVWAMRMEHADQAYQPNDGHRALAALEQLGRLDCVITQNIDGLHQDAGSSTVLELHGNARETKCLGCGTRTPNQAVFERIRAGEDDPHCPDCGGLLKSATISFGEAMPMDVVESAYRYAEAADVCIVVGSSLVVYPAADIPAQTRRAGGALAIINNQPTPLDHDARIRITEPAGETLTRTVEAVRVAVGA